MSRVCPGKSAKIWLALLSIPLGLNFVVRIYAWFVLVRPEGMITQFLDIIGLGIPLASTQAGVFLSLIYGYLPFMFLPLYTVFERLDNTQLQAAIDLGASAWQRWWLIIMPEILPGIVASFVFCICSDAWRIPHTQDDWWWPCRDSGNTN